MTSYQESLVTTATFDGVRFDATTTPPPPPAAASITYLSDLNPVGAINGWGPYERDRSNGETGATDGRTQQLRGATFAKGLGVHARSELRYRLDSRYARFKSTIGVDDEVGRDNGSVVFEVHGDGRMLYRSPTRRGGDQPVAIDIDVSGVIELMLVVTDADDGDAYDHANWSDARVETAAPRAVPAAVRWRELM